MIREANNERVESHDRSKRTRQRALRARQYHMSRRCRTTFHGNEAKPKNTCNATLRPTLRSLVGERVCRRTQSWRYVHVAFVHHHRKRYRSTHLSPIGSLGALCMFSIVKSTGCELCQAQDNVPFHSPARVFTVVPEHQQKDRKNGNLFSRVITKLSCCRTRRDISCAELINAPMRSPWPKSTSKKSSVGKE